MIEKIKEFLNERERPPEEWIEDLDWCCRESLRRALDALDEYLKEENGYGFDVAQGAIKDIAEILGVEE